MIKFTIENNIGKIVLNRPEKFNSFNQAMSLALIKALDDCQTNDSVRSILLTAEGKAFSAGQDLAEAVDPNSPDIRRIVEDHYNKIITAIREIQKPVVCAVNGVAAGAGANVALCCDIVVAGKSSSFIQAFSKIGLVPDSGGTFFLPRLIGFQRASALMILGDKVMADDAMQMGMIYRTFDDEKLYEEALAIATTLSQMATRGIGLTKMLLNESYFHSLKEQLQMEADLQSQAAATKDFKEGVVAFLEKRKAMFTGS